MKAAKVQEELVFPGSARKVAEVLARLQPRRPLLVHGRGSFARSGAAAALEPVIAVYKPRTFSDFGASPRLEDLENGLETLGGDFDLVLAVGGGTTLDMAKLLALFAAQSGRPREYILEGKALDKPMRPVVAVPTTAGSGSEATHFAVCYAGATKYSVAHPSMRPAVAVVDGELTLSMPRAVAASTGIDAFAQAVESFWSIHATGESRSLSRGAIRGVLAHLERSVNAAAREDRIAMAEAAHWAGRAIDVTKTTTPHALSYYFTAKFGVPHGHAVALTLGELLEFNAAVPGGAMPELLELLGCRGGAEGKKKVWALMDAVGLERDFRKLGIGPAEFKAGLRDINWERAKNNPREHTLEQLEALFKDRF